MVAITFHFGEHWKVRENTFLRLNILRWIWQLSEKYCSHICPVTFPMLIRADTFGGDSHNFSGCFSHIIILSGKNRFAWNCFLLMMGHNKTLECRKIHLFWIILVVVAMSENLFLLLEQTLSFVLLALNTTHTFTFFISVALNTLDTFTFFLMRCQSTLFSLVTSGVLH